MTHARSSFRPVRLLPCLLLALALCLLAAAACAETRNVWNYIVDVKEDNTGTIVDYRGAEEEVEVPEELDGIAITAIGDGAFKLRQDITSVVIPEGVVSIGARAFSSCDGIKTLVLPGSLKSIGTRAFSNCKGLRSLVLP